MRFWSTNKPVKRFDRCIVKGKQAIFDQTIDNILLNYLAKEMGEENSFYIRNTVQFYHARRLQVIHADD